jgi:hypothetical protein
LGAYLWHKKHPMPEMQIAAIELGNSHIKKDQIHMMPLRSWLDHPLTRELSIDDPTTTSLRRRIIKDKPFLGKLYDEWYKNIMDSLPSGDGLILEL